ncbi:hypothetical protein ACLOJK_025649 [Asimina triloba]
MNVEGKRGGRLFWERCFDIHPGKYLSNVTFKSQEVSNHSFHIHDGYRKALEELALVYPTLNLSVMYNRLRKRKM